LIIELLPAMNTANCDNSNTSLTREDNYAFKLMFHTELLILHHKMTNR